MKRTSWVTWRLFFITIPVDIFAVVFLSGRTEISLENIHLLALLAISAHFSTAPFIPLGSRLSRRFNNWKVDILTLVLLGAIRGLALLLIGRELEIPNTVIDEFRIVNSAIAFPTWFIFFALLTEARHQYQQEFDFLFHQIKEKSDSENLRKSPKVEGVSNSEELMSRLQSVTSKLGSEIKMVLDESNLKTNYTLESRKIQEFIDKELRPTSKQLWRGGSLNAPPIRKIDLLRFILLEQGLLVKFAILFSAPLLFVGVTGGYGAKIAIVQTSLATLPVLASFIVMEKVHKRNLISRRQSNLLILGMSWLIPILLQFLVVPLDTRMTRSVLAFVIYQTALWVVLVTLLIGFSLFYSINKQRTAVLKSLESLLDDAKYLDFLSSEFNPARDIELSRYLHGEIQTGLTASVLLLQQASKSDDVVLARKALENAVKILSQNHSEGYEKSLSSTDLHLAQIVSGWRGIADVEINLDFLNSIAQAKIRDVVELVGEGVANAIRHGKATRLWVFDEDDSGVIRVHIHSNASDSPQGEAGLGTEMFNRLTLDWQFVSKDGESHLSFTVPKG